ncbi:hypothetical protein SHKM778_54930 [Streptomyces sp. KM77-8]|uniref:Uncharacterized protein n=1 Tax=Streptomyces haneummycinicus TaxID=3074435 RepID=A0AAT9HND8_9ACTN
MTHEHEPNAEAEGGPENDRSLPDAADAPVHATAEESDAPPWPQDEERKSTARILVVQMGHCFRTSGATGTPGEQVFVKAVADACADELGKPGPPGRELWHLRVIKADEPVEEYVGDAFVAFHCDGSTHQNARGRASATATPQGSPSLRHGNVPTNSMAGRAGFGTTITPRT